MKNIRIGPRTQAIGLLSVAGLLGTMFVRELPGIKRYIKIETM